MGSALDGPSGCTCWRPVYDLDQQTPDTTLIPEVRATMCGDCAYRPNSPEKSGDPAAAADGEKLRALVADGVPFWCHVGIRRPTHWAHPSGATTPGDPLDYSPPQRGSTPFKADGTPADLCGGWAAQRLKAVAEAAPDQDRRTPS
jgi:hypothetical protein